MQNGVPDAGQVGEVGGMRVFTPEILGFLPMASHQSHHRRDCRREQSPWIGVSPAFGLQTP